ncbi:hypothetical protein PMAC_000517 [Pneumocystis sp. 'macacae']|nr:hypothetical protein PMAC_000517 [Pneumocystis sp. 'macacae']
MADTQSAAERARLRRARQDRILGQGSERLARIMQLSSGGASVPVCRVPRAVRADLPEQPRAAAPACAPVQRACAWVGAVHAVWMGAVVAALVFAHAGFAGSVRDRAAQGRPVFWWVVLGDAVLCVWSAAQTGAARGGRLLARRVVQDTAVVVFAAGVLAWWNTGSDA